MTADLAIKGGTVVSSDTRARANIYVSDGRVAQVGDADLPAGETVDATGLYVLAGLVDTHVHLMDPGDTEREDFPTGTAAAAAAGVTTVIEHTHSHPLRVVGDLEEKRSHLEGRSNVDFGLAAHVWPDHIDDLPALWHAGVSFFKIFTCTTHGVPGLAGDDLERALTVIASLGAICLVHCEDEAMTAAAEERLRRQGRDDNAVLIEWRSREAELSAVEEVCRLATLTGARVTIAHVSSPEVAGIISRHRARGADIAAEACPQYFALREDEVLTEGPLRKFTPPARARTDADEEAMWSLLHTGALGHVSTDHAPSTRRQKRAGIWEAPFGLPGLDTTGPFLIDAAIQGRIAFEDVARVYSEAPARRYGLYPRKGHVGVGADADLVLVDPDGSWGVVDSDVISKAGWSPFGGRTLAGRVRACYLAGQLVAADRSPFDRRTGRFLPGPGLGSA
ncbi:MAG TPA: amidohydrolase family protein [Acidimicrobiia bacterium]